MRLVSSSGAATRVCGVDDVNPAPRPVDAIANAFVEDYAALDPASATFLGIPGHEDRLPDLSPEGFAAREACPRTRYPAARGASPVDDRERGAQESFLDPFGLALELYDAQVPQSEVSVV